MLTGGSELLHHQDVIAFYERVMNDYHAPQGKDIALFLPCSAKKPYSQSRTHMVIRNQLDTLDGSRRNQIQELIVSEPLGIVPREWEEIYPAAHYDLILKSWFPANNIPQVRKKNGNDIAAIKSTTTPRRGERDEMVSVLGERVARFLVRSEDWYAHRLAFVRSSQREILERASESTGIEIDFVLNSEFARRLIKQKGNLYWIMNGLRCKESLLRLGRRLEAIEI